MNDSGVFGSVEFSVSVGLVPWRDPSEFVHHIVGTAIDADGRRRGTISLKLVSATEAENLGEYLVMVCDADSSVLESVYATLFGPNGETREELDITPGWNNLLFIESLEMEPGHEGTPLRVQVVETSIAVFGSAGLIVAEEQALELSVEEWRQLGFRRIAASPYVFRDQMRTNPYEDAATSIPDEASYTCGACGEVIVVPVDLSQGSSQEYVEDCPVCCRANVIHLIIDEYGHVRIWTELEQDYD